jgi:hypothetical protein
VTDEAGSDVKGTPNDMSKSAEPESDEEARLPCF